MPRGRKREKRPADVIGNAVHVMRIATGDIKEELDVKSGRTRSGGAGSEARAQKLSGKERTEIAKGAALAIGARKERIEATPIPSTSAPPTPSGIIRLCGCRCALYATDECVFEEI
jgi:hypothetical protein